MRWVVLHQDGKEILLDVDAVIAFLPPAKNSKAKGCFAMLNSEDSFNVDETVEDMKFLVQMDIEVEFEEDIANDG